MDHKELNSEELASIRQVVAGFTINGDMLSAAPYGSGHVNDTFVVHMSVAGTEVRYLLQRINNDIFKDVPRLMSNIQRVCDHVQERLHREGDPDASRKNLTVIKTLDGQAYLIDKDGKYWRSYLFVEGALGYDIIENEEQAFVAGQAFANFQKYIVDLPGERLMETIPDFHNTRKRFATLKQAIADDSCDRLKNVADEVAYALAHEGLANELLDLRDAGTIPERITHNDTKLNNVLLDEKTNEAVCVIDLDTLMPGLSLYDFGDLIRTSTSPVAEDEKDASQVKMQMNMYKAVASGFLSVGREFMNEAEIEHMPTGAMTITYETGIRFLTDYLQGDTYFKTKYDDHNLIRCRTQFALVTSMENQIDDMRACVSELIA
ncbi:MAG: aminoglycoside phosphotransferase family protein [Planctomycetes bacterium]|nr:aminoglycoside phosphotransferase family protein [Planctomycetota bacterium]